MGKGSYGRLGLGDSTNHATPQRVRFKDETDSVKLKMVSSLMYLHYILRFAGYKISNSYLLPYVDLGV